MLSRSSGVQRASWKGGVDRFHSDQHQRSTTPAVTSHLLDLLRSARPLLVSGRSYRVPRKLCVVCLAALPLCCGGAVHAQNISPHELTGLDEVRAKYGITGAGQTVAVIDTGVAYDHVALGGGLGPGHRVVGGWDFAENDSDPYDDAPAGFHGTHVSGIVSAADGESSTGVAPAANLVALRAFDDTGAGSFEWIEAALAWVHQNRNAFENPITAVNLSLGADTNSEIPPEWAPLEEELAQLEADGIFISAAAGNQFEKYNSAGVGYPGSSPHVVPVMSTDDEAGQLSFFSQRSTRAIAAPGRLIRSTVPDHAGNDDGVPDDYSVQSGTNMAAPYLTGASVLIREVMGLVGYANITQQTIYDHMIATSDTIYDIATDQNYSRLNLLAAIDELIPDDEYGSTADTAKDLGTLGFKAQVRGLIGTTDDIDFFTFIAASSFSAAVTTSSTSDMDPRWIVMDEQGNVILERAESTISFPVVAGSRYSLGLSTASGIGRFLATIQTGPVGLLTGDYNGDGTVSAADYALWRKSLGSTSDLRADGDNSGAIDAGDYSVWRENFGRALATASSASVPEPTNGWLFLVVIAVVRRQASRFPFSPTDRVLANSPRRRPIA